MLRADLAAQRAIEVAESLARRPGPNTGWVAIDELLYAFRTELSTGQSAIARALSAPEVWDSSYVNQLERAYREDTTGLRPSPIVSTRPATLVLEAERDALERGAELISELDLATSLVRSQPQGLAGVMLRVDRFVAAVQAASPRTLKRVAPGANSDSSNPARDVFISHANEDKDLVARPLAQALEQRGFSVWYDEYALRVGDSLRERIDEGLANCRFGIVVLSHSFFAKRWPKTELDGLAAREAGENSRNIILPVWHELSAADLRVYSPSLAGRVGVSTSEGIPAVADRIAAVLNAPAEPTDPRRQLVQSFPRAEAKGERLRPAYGTLLRALVAAQTVADGFHTRMSIDELESKNPVWDEQIDPLRRAAETAALDLRLETGTDAAVDTFFAAWGEFTLWRIDHNNNVRMPKSVPSAEFARHRDELRSRADRFQEAARAHLGAFDEQEKPPVRVEVAPGVFSIPSGVVRALLVTVYNETPRPQRVTGVHLTLSGGLGDIVFTDYGPFLAPPQLVTETDSYTVRFAFDRIVQALDEERSRRNHAERIRVVGVRIRLASGRQVTADTTGIEALR